MKKLGDNIVETVKDALSVTENWDRYAKVLHLKEGHYSVSSDGTVRCYSLGEIPLTWTQRRSLSRAFKRAHAAITEELVDFAKRRKRMDEAKH